MSEVLDHRFDEALISGYLDGELTQGEEQRVRLHLEDCAHCRELAAELARLREAAMSTEFPVPDDRQWDEAPRGRLSALLRNVGWTALLAWIAGLSIFGLWKLVTDTENLLDALLAFGVWGGLGAVFLSVLIDRFKTYRTDRYRRVQK